MKKKKRGKQDQVIENFKIGLSNPQAPKCAKRSASKMGTGQSVLHLERVSLIPGHLKAIQCQTPTPFEKTLFIFESPSRKAFS